jgi:hypothetical protein
VSRVLGLGGARKAANASSCEMGVDMGGGGGEAFRGEDDFGEEGLTTLAESEPFALATGDDKLRVGGELERERGVFGWSGGRGEAGPVVKGME